MSHEVNHQETKIPDIRYTRMLTCVLYEGGASKMLEMLHHKGINEAYYYGVRGNPIGRASEASNLPELSPTEIVHAVVSADQADYIYNMIYHEFRLDMPSKGVVTINRLVRSTPNTLPADVHEEPAH